VALPAGYAAGDTLIIATTDVGSTPSGWTAIAGFSTQSRAYYKVATGSESSVPMTGGTSSSKTVMLCYRGLNSLDSNSSPASASSTSVSTGSLTTVSADELVVSIYGLGINNSSQSFIAPSGTNTRVNISSNATAAYGLLVVDENQSSPGSSTSRLASVVTLCLLTATSFSFKQGSPNYPSFFAMF
jgi:hypothetical protein